MLAKINVHHYIDIGVNLLYYVLGRTDLRISPFAMRDNAYAEIQRKYDKFDVDWNSAPRISDVWFGWLWPVGNNGPYESPQQVLTYLHSVKEDKELDADVEKLVAIVGSLMPDYLQHWTDIQKEVNATVQSLLESFPTDEILSKNEKIAHRKYESAEAFFYYNLLRTQTAQSWEHNGKSIYIVGLDYLRDIEGFAGFMAHELRHILINQSGIFNREDILALIQRIHPLTKDWQDSSEVGCIIENMNFVLDAWSEKGNNAELPDIRSFRRREEDKVIAKAFYDNQQILMDRSFEEFVEVSLKELVTKHGI